MTEQPTPVLPLLSTESGPALQRLLEELQAALPNEQIDLLDNFSVEQLAEVRVAIAANPSPQLLAELSTRLPGLEWVQSLWAGVDSLLEVAEHSGFRIARLLDPDLASTMAEAALAWTLYLHRRMPDYAALQRRSIWQQLPWRNARDCRVSILGLGALGTASAKRLIDNGFNVSGWSTSEKVVTGVQSFTGTAGLHKVLERADVLLILLPLTTATRGLINRRTLAMLPDSCALINFARGAIVDTNDMLDALHNGRLSHAVLDVFEEEPLPTQSVLWTHPQITLLPHIAAPTNPKSAAGIVARHIHEYRHNGTLPPTVDIEKGY